MVTARRRHLRRRRARRSRVRDSDGHSSHSPEGADRSGAGYPRDWGSGGLDVADPAGHAGTPRPAWGGMPAGNRRALADARLRLGCVHKTGEGAQHPRDIGLAPRYQLERIGGLVHDHIPAVQHAAAGGSGGMQ
jgi:hypothetical protein